MLAFCSMSSTVTPCLLISLMISKMPLTMMGASPRDGSSIMMTLGRLISARPTASICCSPPDRVPPACHERSFSRGNRSNTQFKSSVRSSLRRYAPIFRFSSTVMSGKIRRPSGTSVMPLDTIRLESMPVMSSSRKEIFPAEGFTSPAMARRVELLPAPLAPIRVTISPSGTSRLMPLTASIPP